MKIVDGSSESSSVVASNMRLKIPDDFIAELAAFPEPTKPGEYSKAEYELFDITGKRAAFLLAIVDGEAMHSFSQDTRWDEPVHAWRILISKKYEPGIPALIGRTMIDDLDGWISMEVTGGLRAFGPAVVKPIIDEINDDQNIFAENELSHGNLVDVLVVVAQQHPEVAESVTDFLRQLLARFELFPPNFNSIVVNACADLQDLKAAPLIEMVFAREFLNEEIVDLDHIRKCLPTALSQKEIRREKYDPDDLKYSGDRVFQRVLKSLGVAPNVDEVKCLILGAILAVDLVPPGKVIAEILEDHDGHRVEFVANGQAFFFYREAFSLWNELTQFQELLFSLPDPSWGLNADDEIGFANSIRVFRMGEYLRSFIHGLSFGQTNHVHQAGSLIEEFVEFVIEKIDQFEELEKDLKYPTEIVEPLLRDLDVYWRDHYLEFAKACVKARERATERIAFFHDNKEVGRNDPCPCGSGKKFKKCCLAEL